uniref:CxC2-like cysteine cluster KDZ transposase-associated domain-containing protein n=1 Tax=Mycena chlorophos TaxID=658473 RepID=A0ABQ0KUJ2_MYCCL|nr:predicted protein [Mycena chlorophos]
MSAAVVATNATAAPKKRGRPKGSKNKPREKGVGVKENMVVVMPKENYGEGKVAYTPFDAAVQRRWKQVDWDEDIDNEVTVQQCAMAEPVEYVPREDGLCCVRPSCFFRVTRLGFCRIDASTASTAISHSLSTVPSGAEMPVLGRIWALSSCTEKLPPTTTRKCEYDNACDCGAARLWDYGDEGNLVLCCTHKHQLLLPRALGNARDRSDFLIIREQLDNHLTNPPNQAAYGTLAARPAEPCFACDEMVDPQNPCNYPKLLLKRSEYIDKTAFICGTCHSRDRNQAASGCSFAGYLSQLVKCENMGSKFGSRTVSHLTASIRETVYIAAVFHLCTGLWLWDNIAKRFFTTTPGTQARFRMIAESLHSPVRQRLGPGAPVMVHICGQATNVALELVCELDKLIRDRLGHPDAELLKDLFDKHVKIAHIVSNRSRSLADVIYPKAMTTGEGAHILHEFDAQGRTASQINAKIIQAWTASPSFTSRPPSSYGPEEISAFGNILTHHARLPGYASTLHAHHHHLTLEYIAVIPTKCNTASGGVETIVWNCLDAQRAEHHSAGLPFDETTAWNNIVDDLFPLLCDAAFSRSPALEKVFKAFEAVQGVGQSAEKSVSYHGHRSIGARWTIDEYWADKFFEMIQDDTLSMDAIKELKQNMDAHEVKGYLAYEVLERNHVAAKTIPSVPWEHTSTEIDGEKRYYGHPRKAGTVDDNTYQLV